MRAVRDQELRSGRNRGRECDLWPLNRLFVSFQKFMNLENMDDGPKKQSITCVALLPRSGFLLTNSHNRSIIQHHLMTSILRYNVALGVRSMQRYHPEGSREASNLAM